MSARLRIPAAVADTIRGMHPEIKRKVRVALQSIVDAPESGKALKEELAGLRSWRLGRFRIVYRIAPKLDILDIEIVAIGPRRSIYEDTYRQIRHDAG